MIAALQRIHGHIGLIVIGAPLAFILPFSGEAIQHFAEVRLGMFTTGDGLQAGQENSIRLMFGAAKVGTFLLSIILTVRFLDERIGVSSRSLTTWARGLNRYDLSSIAILIIPATVPMAIHYWLNYFAVGKNDTTLFIMLTADSFVVAVFAIIVGSSVHELLLRAPNHASSRST